MFPLEVRVDTEIDFAKLVPAIGKRIAFDELPSLLQNNLQGFLECYQDRTILVREGSDEFPLIILVDGVTIHPEELLGPKDLLCTLFQAAWWAIWVYHLASSDNCVICKDIITQQRCNNPNCTTHMMINDILGPVEHELKRTGTNG